MVLPRWVNPGVPDRQLWAIGMVVVQWGMTETLIDQEIRVLIADDLELQGQYQRIRNFQPVVDFFQDLVERQLTEPLRAKALELITRVRNLSSQRDEIIHRLWGWRHTTRDMEQSRKFSEHRCRITDASPGEAKESQIARRNGEHQMAIDLQRYPKDCRRDRKLQSRFHGDIFSPRGRPNRSRYTIVKA
jgi:hypothetical protein